MSTSYSYTKKGEGRKKDVIFQNQKQREERKKLSCEIYPLTASSKVYSMMEAEEDEAG